MTCLGLQDKQNIQANCTRSEAGSRFIPVSKARTNNFIFEKISVHTYILYFLYVHY